MIRKKDIIKVTDKRIPEKERCPCFYYYEIRHDDNWEMDTIISYFYYVFFSYHFTFEKKVLINFWGTLVLNKELKIPEEGYYILTEADKDKLYDVFNLSHEV